MPTSSLLESGRMFILCYVSILIPMFSRQPFSTISMSRPSSVWIRSSALCPNTRGIKSSAPSTNSPDATRSSFADTDLSTCSFLAISWHNYILPYPALFMSASAANADA